MPKRNEKNINVVDLMDELERAFDPVTSTVMRDNPWIADLIRRYPDMDYLLDAVAELDLRLANGGGTRAPNGDDDAICWYSDEQIDDAFYTVRDAPSMAEEYGGIEEDLYFEYDDDARSCCGEPVAICPACGTPSAFCLDHNGNCDRCESCDGHMRDVIPRPTHPTIIDTIASLEDGE